MKILHVLDVSWPIQRGYSVRAYYITKYQKANGLEPIVLTSERQYDDNTEVTQEGIHYFRSDNKSNLPSIVPALREFNQIVSLKKRICEIVEAEDVDLIHAHSPSLWGLAAYFAGKKLNKKVVYEIRAFWEDAAVDAGKSQEKSVRYRLSKALETFLIRRVNKVVAICEGLKTDLLTRNIPEDSILVVPNGIDIEQFVPIAKNKELLKKYNLDGMIVCGFIGSMFNFEGLELLVETAEDLRNKWDNLRFVLVGEGERFEHIRSMIKAKNLEDIFYLVGKVPHNEISNYYSIIDIFIYPRLRKRITETVTPLKPLEAMAMGKAVIVSDVGGLKELVPSEEYGLTFEAGNVQDLKSKIDSLCGSPDRIVSIGQSARKMVQENRDWKDVVPLYKEKVYS